MYNYDAMRTGELDIKERLLHALRIEEDRI